MSDFIDDAIAAANVKMLKPEDKAEFYLCTLTSDHGKMVREIQTKEGYGAPGLGNLIYHFAMSAQNIDQYDDILQWSDDNELELNDPKTMPKYKQLVENKDALRLLLSEPIYLNMMAALEISQAIDNARPR